MAEDDIGAVTKSLTPEADSVDSVAEVPEDPYEGIESYADALNLVTQNPDYRDRGTNERLSATFGLSHQDIEGLFEPYTGAQGYDPGPVRVATHILAAVECIEDTAFPRDDVRGILENLAHVVDAVGADEVWRTIRSGAPVDGIGTRFPITPTGIAYSGQGTAEY